MSDFGTRQTHENCYRIVGMVEELKLWIEGKLEDSRQEWKVLHTLLDIVVTVICAVSERR